MDKNKHWLKRLGQHALTLFLGALFVLLVTHIDDAIRITFNFNFLQLCFCLYVSRNIKKIHEYLYK